MSKTIYKKETRYILNGKECFFNKIEFHYNDPNDDFCSYIIEDFYTACNFIRVDECRDLRVDTTYFRNIPYISMVTKDLCLYRVNKKHFERLEIFAEITEVKDISFSDLKSELPATEFLDYLYDNYKGSGQIINL